MHSFRVSKPNVYKWNSIISAHTKLGEIHKAFDVFSIMTHEGLQPDTATFLSLLKSSTARGYLRYCRSVHDYIIRFDLEADLMVCNALVHSYAKSGSLDEAHNVFERSGNRDVVTWGSIMFAHIQHGNGVRVLELFNKVQQEGIMPDNFIYICLLKACKITGAIDQGISIHAEMVKRGIDLDTGIGNSLIDMYGKCASLEEANRVFDDMPVHDLVSWGALIEGFSLQGQGYHALELFEELQCEGLHPNKVILLFIMKACSGLGFLEQGMVLHDQIIRGAFESDLALGSALVDFYSNCGKLGEAHRVFDVLPNKDAAAWGAMIGGYTQSGDGLPALGLFVKLHEEGIKPSNATFSSTLKACGVVGNLEAGRQLHHQIIDNGLQSNGVIVSALVDMYAKCGSLMEAQKVFNKSSNQDVVSWGAIIARYATQGHSFRALELFQKMQEEGVKPVKTIFLCILKACSSMGALSWGSLIHAQIIESGLEADVVVGNALINLYAKSGSLDDARKLFDQLPNKDAVSWNTMVAGYTSHGHDFSALRFVEEMHLSGVEASKATYSNMLKVCGNIGAIIQGKLTHNGIVKDGLQCDVVVGSALVDMYAKCGCMGDARKIFDELPEKDVVSWGAVTAGYALHGDCIMARQCFLDMQRQGMHLSEAVFTNMLVAFTHAGLLEEGCKLFNSVSEHHCDFLNAEHYSCMVNLLGRVGQLDDAGDLFRSMPVGPCMPTWRSLLTSCRTHGNVGLGRQCFNLVVELDSISACG